jgi:cyanoexosortase A
MNFQSLTSNPKLQWLYDQFKSWISQIPPPTPRNLWLTMCALVALQNLVIFTNTQMTGNAIIALLVWGGALICMEDQLDELKPNPSLASLTCGATLVLYTLYRWSRIEDTDLLLYILVPIVGLGLTLMVTPAKRILIFRDSLLILCLLPVFIGTQIVVATYVTDDLSLFTAKFVLSWLGILGISPANLVGDTVYVNGGAVQVMHECNGFEMIMQMFITSIIFLVAFPLRSRLGRLFIFTSAPLLGFVINSFRISLLAVFISLNSQMGKKLFDFFHEEAGSLIFSGIAVFLLGYIYLQVLERELPPLQEN